MAMSKSSFQLPTMRLRARNKFRVARNQPLGRPGHTPHALRPRASFIEDSGAALGPTCSGGEGWIRISKRWAKGEDGETKTDASDGYVPLHPVEQGFLRDAFVRDSGQSVDFG